MSTMSIGSSDDRREQIPFVSLMPFLLIAFGLAWGILALFIFLPDQMTKIFRRINRSTSALLLGGVCSCDSCFHCYHTKMWRWGLVALSFPAFALALLFVLVRIFDNRHSATFYWRGSALKGNLFAEPFPFSSFQSLFVALVFAAIKGPVEEFGWRGLALPLMQRKLTPIWAGLILGVIWGFWHLPAFLLSGTQQSAWSFTPFFAGSVAISVIMTPLFNTSRGSILLPALFHFQLINPIWPDAQPYDTYLFVVATVLVVWINRKTMFSKEGGVTEVIPR